jgi:hypothetical protein
LKFDEYAGNTRFRRFGQYRMSRRDGAWAFERLEQRPYVTFTRFNPIAGGIRREYAPLVADFEPWLRHAADHLPLETDQDWQINVHQIRVLARRGEPGVVVPEGPHQDGHEFVFIGVFDRHQVVGGELQLMPLDDKHGEPFFRTTVPAGQGVLLKDLELWHNVTEVEPVGDAGYRDTLIAPFSKWSDKWYGDDFEARALADES